MDEVGISYPCSRDQERFADPQNKFNGRLNPRTPGQLLLPPDLQQGAKSRMVRRPETINAVLL